MNTRVKKLEEYRTSIIKKIHDAIAKFTKLHLAMVAKNKECYRNSLFYAFGKSVLYLQELNRCSQLIVSSFSVSRKRLHAA